MKNVLLAIADAVIAAAIVGMFEATRVRLVSGQEIAPLAWCVLAALAGASAWVACSVLFVGGVALSRIGAVARTWQAIEEGGRGRVVIVWRVVLVAASMLVAGGAIMAVASRMHDHFRFIDGGPVGLGIAVIATPLVALVMVGARALDRRVRDRLPEHILDGHAAKVALAAALLAIVMVPVMIVHAAIPAVDLGGVTLAGVTLAIVVGIRVARIGRARVPWVTAPIVLFAWGLGISQLGASEEARGLVVVHGVYGKATAKFLWHLTDHDGDGYADSTFGGADCDDDDPKRNPGVIDVEGNAIDENCTLSDGWSASHRNEAIEAVPAARSSIVLISVDALRADHLGTWHYGRPTSPAIDAFAKNALVFEQAFTSCPSTRCAIPSLLTGRMPSTLRDAGDVPTLAGVLRAAGYETATISCCDRFALARAELAGFDHIDVSADSIRMQREGQSNSDVVVDSALAWLARPHDKPFFLWVHLYDPHHPYWAPQDPTRFGTSDLDRYDAEIAYVDAQIGRLLAAIDRNTTIVALTADHGDEFGEHGIRFHARSLYAQVVHIPLIIAVPGWFEGATRGDPVSIVDVMPTLLHLVGLEAPAGLNGIALPYQDSSRAGRDVVIELVPDAQIERDMIAVIAGDKKIIWDRAANAWSKYALSDAADRHPLDVTDDDRWLLRHAVDRELSRLMP